MKKQPALFIIICILVLFSCSNPSSDDSDNNFATGVIKLNVTYPNGPIDYLSRTIDATIKIYDSSGNTIKQTYVDDFSNDLTIDSVSCNMDCSIDVTLAGYSTGTISGFSVIEDSITTVDVICTPIESLDTDLNSLLTWVTSDGPVLQWFTVSLTSGVKYSFRNGVNDSKLFFYDADSTLIFSIDGQGTYEYESDESDESDEYYIVIASKKPIISYGVFNSNPLELETYAESSVSSDGERVWYQIPVTGGKTYQINWDDYNSGTCSYTGDIRVGYICEDSTTGYVYYSNINYTGGTVTVGENVNMLYIEPYPNESDGTFRLEVVQYSGSATIFIQ